MKRHQLEHVLRAAGAIVAVADLIVIGSQAVLGWSDSPPAALLASLEVDIYPRYAPELANVIDGTIGELSPFHETFGYYAHGVAPETATLPEGWEDRLIGLSNENTNGVTGWCLHPVDIAISKLAAGRPKDLSYVCALIESVGIDCEELKRLASTLDESAKGPVLGRISRLGL